ncbi:hypothetical protein L2E82_21846 [Cichorium intybus]|uniref:Uncharacterized protein n=1 Tax=Cichorium intybus TaxID=13427 RepID=A0ACB9DXF7_CICIN|nr:hypothetical protein L2E82_21846 [Cichorium intybus]
MDVELINLDSRVNRISDKVTYEEVEDMDDNQRNSVTVSCEEGSGVIDAHIEEAKVSLHTFLIRVPRFEDEKLNEQIKNAELQLYEKIRCRNAIGAEILDKRAILIGYYEAYEAANLEYIAAKKLLRSKLSEIQSIQHLIENVISIEDIDTRIIKEERLIELLNQRRDQKREINERMKKLEKEVDSIKDNKSKAKEVALAIIEAYEEEKEKRNELKAQFEPADEAYHQAYKHLNSLKNNKFFYMYIRDVTAARNFASAGDKAALHRLCANQVERFMNEWNTNAEFRKDYTSMIKPNTHEETLNVGNLSKTVATNPVPIMEPIAGVSRVEQGKRIVSSPDTEKVEQAKKTVSSPDMEDKENENTRKEDELRKEETEYKLKEQIRLEERKNLKKERLKAKKAQKRADQLEAQKEAELKEKANEKRLRKKKRKMTHGNSTGPISSNNNSISNSMNDDYTVKSNEIEKPNHKPQVVASTIGNRRWHHQWLKMITTAVCSYINFKRNRIRTEA